jgi:hypothetical protein
MAIKTGSAKIALIALMFSVSTLTLGPAQANDSTAQMKAGGLVLQSTQAVAMQSEDLYISRDKIRVRYVYRNLTNRPVTLTITFPLPDRVYSEGDQAIPRDNGTPDFVNFTTKIDGRNVALTPILQATFNDRDVSQQLRALGLLMAPDGSQTQTRITAFTATQRAQLARSGLIDDNNNPQWTLKTNFVRQQTFPVGRDVVVEHQYQAGTGGTVGTMVTATDPSRETMAEYRQTYCVDADFIAAAKRQNARRPTQAELGGFTENWVTYVLKTGANWARPIGRFRLVVDKGAPDVLVSFCGSGVRRISPTQFEMVKTNFLPTRDLDVLFLIPMRAQ